MYELSKEFAEFSCFGEVYGSILSSSMNVGFRAVVSAIDRRFDFLQSQDADECECALEALGQIGLCKYAIDSFELIIYRIFSNLKPPLP